jgi:hypothetical protein
MDVPSLIFGQPSVVRFVGTSACAAWLTLEHLRLAWTAGRLRGRAVGVLCFVLPLAGAVEAWRRGARFSPILYALLGVGYLVLRLV